jgi:DNA mismatch repair protein MutS
MQTEVMEKNGGIIFTHRLIAGASASSFGIEVAKLAGVPDHVIEMAKARLSVSEALESEAPGNRMVQGASAVDLVPKALSKVQKGLFALASDSDDLAEGAEGFDQPGLSRVMSRLESVKIHKTTPLQALNILNELKSMLVPVQHRALFDDESMHQR